MTLIIEGTFRNGVFHPDKPVELPDNTRVSMAVNAVDTPLNAISISTEESDADRDRTKVHEILVAAGVVRPGPVPGPGKSTLSPKRRAELAQKLAELGPLYDIIREERDRN